MEKFFIRPAAPGADIRDPNTMERLPDGGAEKPRDAYWVALHIRGDVIAVDPEPAKPTKSGKASD